MVEEGLSIREIAAQAGRSPSTVRHWLGRFGLRTSGRPGRRPSVQTLTRECARHPGVGLVAGTDGVRCPRCRTESVSEWRRRAKRLLVAEAGGCCRLCGYDRCVAALQFHHLDPTEKRFGIGGRGLSRSISALREEAAKCVLLCANCHVEVEAGTATLTGAGPDRG